MKKILTINSWQLFCLIIGLTIILNLYFEINNTPITLRQIIYTIPFCIYLIWIYSIGINLYKRLPSTNKININQYKTVFFLISSYLCLILILNLKMHSGSLINQFPFSYIIISFLGYILGLFYIIYTTSKMLRSVELGRNVSFIQFRQDFIIMCIFPIGVWIIQPRINKIFYNNLVS
jgi:hypothetical protein